MSIKIVLPDGEAPKSGSGTKIFTDEGHEIKGVVGCNIEIMPNSVIRARLDVFVEDIENLESINGEVTIINPEDAPEVWPAIVPPKNEGTYLLDKGERVADSGKADSVDKFIADIVNGAKN